MTDAHRNSLLGLGAALALAAGPMPAFTRLATRPSRGPNTLKCRLGRFFATPAVIAATTRPTDSERRRDARTDRAADTMRALNKVFADTRNAA